MARDKPLLSVLAEAKKHPKTHMYLIQAFKRRLIQLLSNEGLIKVPVTSEERKKWG